MSMYKIDHHLWTTELNEKGNKMYIKEIIDIDRDDLFKSKRKKKKQK